MDFSWSIFYEWLVEIKAQGFKTKPGANNERVQKKSNESLLTSQ